MLSSISNNAISYATKNIGTDNKKNVEYFAEPQPTDYIYYITIGYVTDESAYTDFVLDYGKFSPGETPITYTPMGDPKAFFLCANSISPAKTTITAIRDTSFTYLMESTPSYCGYWLVVGKRYEDKIYKKYRYAYGRVLTSYGKKVDLSFSKRTVCICLCTKFFINPRM